MAAAGLRLAMILAGRSDRVRRAGVGDHATVT